MVKFIFAMLIYSACTHAFGETYLQGGVSSFRSVSGISGKAIGVDVGHSYKGTYGSIDASIGIFEADLYVGSLESKWSGVMTYGFVHTPAWNRMTAFSGYQITQQSDNTWNKYLFVGISAHLDPVKISAVYASDGKERINMLVIKYRMNLFK
jgi:hypothetical protein